MTNQTTINHLNKARNVLERVTGVEQVLFGEFDPKTGAQKSVGALESLSKNIDVTRNQISALGEVIEALAQLLGVTEEAVQGEIKRARVDAARREAGEQQAKLATIVNEKRLLADDTIGPESIIVGHETTPDGTVVEPGWFLHAMSQIKENNRAELLGKQVGFVLTTDQGNLYKVSEIYEVNATPPEAAPAPSEGPKVDSTVELMPPSLTTTPPQE